MSSDVSTTRSPLDGFESTLESTLESSTQSVANLAGTVMPGVIIGRYVVLSKLGAGAMGVVLAAYDPELDRKVALKLLNPRSGPQDAARARLQREAQALARLDHPNVVGVYDVGVHEGQLFVGMEFVEGQTLGEWMAAVDEPRPWPDVVRVFMEAGRGLAAAHEAGLVHRDFKPDNVMLGNDGRVRVMDFGVARTNDDPDGEHDGGSDGGSAEDVLEQVKRNTGKHRQLDALTRTGVMLGTPAYMAIEQFEGREADARSDQFSFCVALYQGLYGQRPFAGDNLEELIRSVADEQIREPPKRTRVPTWLRKMVVSGLAADRDARWPSMAALLSALATDPSVGRRRRVVGVSVLALTGALATGLWGFGQHRHEQLVASCTRESDSVQQIWNVDRAATLELRFTETGNPAAASSWDSTRLWLDVYAEDLGRLRQENCMATRVEHTRAEGDAALVDACLDDNQANFEALVEVLLESRAGMIQHAASAASKLPLLASCTDMRRQSAVPQPSAEVRKQLRRQLHRGEVLRIIGELDEARVLAQGVLARAEALGWRSAGAEARLALAHLQVEASEFEKGQRLAELAFRKASVAGDTILMLDAALLIAQITSDRGEYADSEAWSETSAELISSGGLESSMLAARLAVIQSATAGRRGRLADARAQAERGLQLHEAILGPDHPNLADALEALTVALQELDELELAAATTERQLDILARAYGPDNIRLINVYNSFGATLHIAGELDRARDYYLRGIAMIERVFGPENFQLLAPLLNMGLLAYDGGDLESARVYFERALKIDRAVSDENADSIKLLVNLGNTASRQGRHEQALAYFDRCVTILEAAQQDSFDMRETFVRSSYADAYVRLGDLDAAYPLYERVVTVVMALSGSDDAKLVRPLLGLAGIDIERGDLDAAQAKLTRAATLIELEPWRRWALEFLQGQLLWARGERQQARAQLQALRDQQAGPESDWPYASGEIDAWLASHALP
jgi:eukaryotic-like serine/threonine-protein kinase